MDAQVFWNVIGDYNNQTIIIQFVLFAFLIVALVLSYNGKIKWLAKAALGISNLYIGIVFFGVFGTSPYKPSLPFPSTYAVAFCSSLRV